MLIGDTESNGFKYEATKIWVICMFNTVEKLYTFSFDKSIEWTQELQEMLPPAHLVYRSHEEHIEYMNEHTVCMHNYFQHDKLLIKKLYPSFQPKGEEDSFILSQLFSPDRGTHGLGWWGSILGHPKPEHEEWDKFSPEMLTRVIEDVHINIKVWNILQKEKREWEELGNSWDKAIKIEYGVADLQGRQEMYGLMIDQDKAYDVADEIFLEIQKIDEYLQYNLPYRVIKQPEVKYEKEPFTKTGKVTANATKWFEGEEVVWGPFRRVTFEEINLNSPTQIKDYLLSVGWKPLEWTKPTDLHPNGSPKLTVKNAYMETVPCPSLLKLDDELGKALGKRSILKHRAGILFGVRKRDNQLTGILNTVRSDGRIEAGAITNSTNTARMAHRGLVNVPKPKDKDLWPSNTQIRELFIVPEGKLMMGIDADALEARMEAHACLPYEGGEAYAFELLEGDVHANNAEIFGTDRDGAKAPKYALTYGCTPKRLEATLGCSLNKAKRLYNDFWEGNTALSAFKKAVTTEWKKSGRKYIKGIDGRRIAIRSEHSIVNANFQSTGSIVVKVAALFLDKWIQQKGLDAHQIIIYHDEFEYEILPQDKEVVGELASLAFKKAGEWLGIRVPTTGSPEYGLNWKEVH